ncbi:hypothetical protein [Streptomyces malaysiensis]|nr:hypothetical protein R8789_38500 [Streptomyces malaysiensis]
MSRGWLRSWAANGGAGGDVGFAWSYLPALWAVSAPQAEPLV